MIMTEPDDIDLACNQWVELLTEYLDGSLDPPIVAAIESHLSICPACVLYLNQITETIATLGAMPIETLSEQSKRELVAAFRDLQVPRR